MMMMVLLSLILAANDRGTAAAAMSFAGRRPMGQHTRQRLILPSHPCSHPVDSSGELFV